VIPRRVYEELGGAPDRSTPGQTPINSAIDACWVTVADDPDYTNSTVSRVMDGVRRYIANSSNRNEDHIEKADAGEGVVAALEANGFEHRIRFKDGFELIDEIT